jgi:hypothetical protein
LPQVADGLRFGWKSFVEVGEGDAEAVVGLLAEALTQRQAEDQDEDQRHDDQNDDCPPIAEEESQILGGERPGNHARLAEEVVW